MACIYFENCESAIENIAVNRSNEGYNEVMEYKQFHGLHNEQIRCDHSHAAEICMCIPL